MTTAQSLPGYAEVELRGVAEQPYVRQTPKIGRGEPCPSGRGMGDHNANRAGPSPGSRERVYLPARMRRVDR